MFNNLASKKFLMAIPVAAALALTGCEEEDVASAAAPEAVDLTQTEDLFEAPVKPNPLTEDPAAVVVRVNGEEITRGEIQMLVGAQVQQLAGRIPPEQLPMAQKQMFERVKSQLITQKLLDAEVAKANIVIDDAEITQIIEQLSSRLPEGTTFEQALAARGTTLEELQQNIKNDMTVQKFLETKADGVAAATESDAKSFYDENSNHFKKPESVTASHILLSFDSNETDEGKAAKKAQLEKIRADIIAGTTTFEDAAQAHSGCPSSAKGGSLGTFVSGQMVPAFEAAAFSQEVDEVGDVVETRFGYHIIKVAEHADEAVVPFEEAKERILAELGNQAKQKAVADYLDSLRNAATIEELVQ